MGKSGSSPLQPKATKPLATFQEYSGETGKALSCIQEIRDISKYYAPDPKARYSDHGWDSTGPSKYVPFRINGAEDAYEAIDKFQFPAQVRGEAMRSARHLVGVFEKVASPTVLHNLPVGRIDRRKIPAVAEATAMGKYDPGRILPFKKTIPSPSKTPVIAVVADGNFMHMWMDPEYIPRMLMITTGILWACEAVGMKTYASITCGHSELQSSKLPYQEAIWAMNFATPNRTIPLRNYACMLHRDLFRFMLITSETADVNMWRKFCDLQGYDSSCGSTWGSRHGGYAVKWAREVLNADVVISIGDVLDRAKAEVQLGYDFTITDAVKEIAKQEKNLRKVE